MTHVTLITSTGWTPGHRGRSTDMLSERDLQDYFEALQLSADARAIVRRVRLTDPARATGTGRGANSARFASRKMGSTIQADSLHGEEAACWVWEHDDTVLEYWDQPPTVRVVARDKTGRRYGYNKTFDYFLLSRSFCGWVEFERRAEIEERVRDGDPNYYQDESGKWHFQPGEALAEESGLGFELRLVEDNNVVLAANVRFLVDYLSPQAPAVKSDTARRIRQRLELGGWLRLSDMVRGGELPWEPDDVYKMIANRQIYFPLDRDLLSDLDHVYVFADETAAMAFNVMQRAQCVPPPRLAAVELEPGQSLTLYGKPWTVIDVSAKGLVLTTEQGAPATFDWPAIHELIDKKHLQGVESISKEPSAAAIRLRSASSGDHKVALSRYKAIFPGKLDLEPVSDVPPRTLRYWRKLFQDGTSHLGNGYLGLLPQVSRRGNRNRQLTADALSIIHRTINEKYLTSEAPTRKMAWGMALTELKANGVSAVSLKTFSKEVHRTHTLAEATKLREGSKASYQVQCWHWRLDSDTPPHGQRPWEVVHIDHTQVDLQLLDPRFRRVTRKVWVTAMIDAYSRVVLAVYLSFRAPSSASNMCVLRECIRRHQRVPTLVVVDHGKDFKSGSFQQLAARLEISVRYRPRSSPRHGAVIERLFRRWNDDLVHNLKGNNKALQNPRFVSTTHDPRGLAVWTLNEFEPEFKDYLFRVYATELVHETLGVPPQQAYDTGMLDSGMRRHTLIQMSDDLEMMFWPLVKTRSGKVKVYAGGRINIGYIDYHAPELNQPGIEGTQREVRYDADNAAHVRVFLGNEWIEAKSSWHHLFQRYSPTEVEQCSKLLHDQVSAGRRARPINAERLAQFMLGIELKEAKLATEKAARTAPESGAAEFRAIGQEFADLIDRLLSGGQWVPPDSSTASKATTGAKAPGAPADQPSGSAAAYDPFTELATNDYGDIE
jgi:putative transposase